MTEQATMPPLKVATGIAGLDEILQGGLPIQRTYLVQGASGTGKTTLGLQFLLTGVQAGETALHLTLAETYAELQEVATGHGWLLTGIHVHELRPLVLRQLAMQQTVFPVAEVELDELIAEILRLLDELRPQRVVFDFITELRLLATTPLRYRQQLFALQARLQELQCTTLFLSNELLQESDLALDSLVHGVLILSQTIPEYGEVHRRLAVNKLRGMSYSGGYHDLRIVPGGLVVYPRVQPRPAQSATAWETLSSGVPGLDQLCGGGLETGTACLITGQAGTGKSTVAMLYAYAALQRGEAVVIFLFDERTETWYQRATKLGLNLESALAQGNLHIQQINTAEMSPGQFATLVRRLVDEQGVKVVVVDSLTGYLSSMSGQKFLLSQMHELLAALGQRGVLSLVIVTQHGLFDISDHEPLDLSYLADTVLVLRHFEAEGVVRQAIAVVKKRYAAHEHTIRELRITAQGVQVGLPLVAFRGILTGNPQYVGSALDLFNSSNTEGQDGKPS